MIRYWEYDTTATPHWRCMMYFRECDYEAVQQWFKLNCIGKYDCVPRYNSGDRALYIMIYNRADMIAFKMAWG